MPEDDLKDQVMGCLGCLGLIAIEAFILLASLIMGGFASDSSQTSSG